MGDDINKLKKFNKQLDNLSKSINTLSRLFKSFTSQKRPKKIKQTTEFKQALFPQFILSDNEDVIKPIKIRKTKQEKKEVKKLNRKQNKHNQPKQPKQPKPKKNNIY